MVKDFGLADRKFVSFPSHIFNQDRQMEFSSSGYLKAVCALTFFHPETDIRIQLPEQTVS